jgi:hypothetical protein
MDGGQVLWKVSFGRRFRALERSFGLQLLQAFGLPEESASGTHAAQAGQRKPFPEKGMQRSSARRLF